MKTTEMCDTENCMAYAIWTHNPSKKQLCDKCLSELIHKVLMA